MKGPAKLLLLSFTVALMCTLAVAVLQMQPGDTDTVTKYTSVQSLYYPTSITALERNTFIETAYGEYTPSASSNAVSPDMPKDVAQYDTMPMAERWALCTNGWLTGNPTEWKYGAYLDKYNALQSSNSVNVTVNLWQWKSNDPNDYTTVLKAQTLEVNKAIAPMVTQMFKEMESFPEYPLYLGQAWKVRSTGGGYDTAKSYSRHSYGVCLDFNASAYLSTELNNKFSTATKHATTAIWNAQPKSKTKYLVFYDDSPIVQIFKKYGWRWGGDYKSQLDGMHFEYLY